MSDQTNLILIVEDDPGLGNLFSETLESHGLRCSVAPTGEECLRRVAESRVDLLILDYSLPDMDGTMLIQELERSARLPAFVVITGHGDEKVAVRCMKMGARDYLVKDPHLLRRLPEVVRRILGEVDTQRRLSDTESALREANQRLTMHVEHTPLGVVEFDAEGCIRRWNPAATAIFGYYHEEIIGQHLNLILPECVRPRVAITWERLMTQTGGSRAANENVTKDGRRIQCEWFNTPLVDSQGRTIGVASLVQDVTERTRMEVALRQSEAGLREAQRIAQLGNWSMDLPSKRLQWSEEIFRIFELETTDDGPSHEDFVQTVHPADRELVTRTFAASVAQRAPYEVEHRLLLPDGRIKYVQERGHTLYAADGTPLRTIGTVQDITARRQAEDDLRASEERFRLVSMASSDLVYSCREDTAGQLALDWAAGAVERITGYTLADLMNRGCWAFLVEDEDKPRFLSQVANLPVDGSGSCELRIRRADGTLLWVSSRAQCVADPRHVGQRCLHGSITDITESKRLEGQYLRAQRLETLGSLAGGVAHDLNNVFTPIMMSVSLLQSIAKEPHEIEMVSLLEDCARRGAGILRQLLQFGRGQEGPIESVQLADVVREVSHIMQETFPKNIAVNQQVSPDLWNVNADQTQMHQVLLNLCVNARDAMPGGGQLSITACNEVLDANVTRQHLDARPGPHVCLRVTDTGIGIKRDVMEKIFEPFFTTKPLGQGNGLGLPTVLDIVRKHRGFITAESQLGTGSQFTVYLPAALDPIPPTPFTASSSTRSPAGELVLLIDDEPAIRFMVERALHQFGYRVITSDDGRAAVDLLAAQAAEVRLVITDMMMPNIDGLETIRLLRDVKPQVPIIAISGVSSYRTEIEKLPPPGVLFLEKPFSLDSLLSLLHAAIEPPATPSAAGKS